ncbi:MAG TPA: hypothetical protein VFT82_01220 [Candidatus Paceibacterota bacterium]|nr:hypothetical protein [Candidatus Paceibacterota bacterium]
MNPEQEEICCPATVYRDRGCTETVGTDDRIGWMIWGRRPVAAVLAAGLWVPHGLAHAIRETEHPPRPVALAA